MVNGFVKEVLQQLPMEFAVEAQKLISIQPRRQRGMRLRASAVPILANARYERRTSLRHAEWRHVD